MFVHRDRLHSRTTRFGLMALVAFKHTPAIRRHDTGFSKMDLMIKFEIRTLCCQRLGQSNMLRTPLDTAVHIRALHQQADTEIRMCI